MTEPTQRESRVLRRARELVVPQGDSIAWAENVFTLCELLRGPGHSALKGLRGYIDAAHATGQYQFTDFQAVIRGVATGLLSDVESGFLPDLQTKIRAEVEGDFLARLTACSRRD